MKGVGRSAKGDSTSYAGRYRFGGKAVARFVGWIWLPWSSGTLGTRCSDQPGGAQPGQRDSQRKEDEGPGLGNGRGRREEVRGVIHVADDDREIAGVEEWDLVVREDGERNR